MTCTPTTHMYVWIDVSMSVFVVYSCGDRKGSNREGRGISQQSHQTKQSPLWRTAVVVLENERECIRRHTAANSVLCMEGARSLPGRLVQQYRTAVYEYLV